MNSFSANYEKILETLQKVESKMNFRNQKRKPKLSDIELISIDLTSEFLGTDSERDLFRKLPSELTSKIERSVFNRRKRGLFTHRDILRKALACCISTQDYYIVDSMPLEVCKLKINMIINLKRISLENLENELKLYFLNYVTNL